MNNHLPRCTWCGSDPLYIDYHDNDWGVPVHDDRQLFEMLMLEGAQAGLSWITILRKREGYRTAFDHFDINTVAAYEDKKLEALRENSGIVRNRLKIASAVKNARAVQTIQYEHGSFDSFLWDFVDGKVTTVGQELDAGGRRGQQLYTVASLLECLVYVAPDNAAHLGMAVEYGKKVFGIIDSHGVQPDAAHRYRLVV